MSTITDYLRPYWLKNINEVEGNVIKGLRGWLVDSKYQIYKQLQPDSAVLTVDNDIPLISAFAADSKRMSSAAFETICGICPESMLPKSLAWLVVRSYYSAFFAAHAILLMFGVSCSMIEAPQANSINTVADLYNVRNGITFNKGFYSLSYDSTNRFLLLNKLDTGDGAHTSMWKIFYNKFQQIITNITHHGGSSSNTQSVLLKLTDLCQALDNYREFNKGDWLLKIRNRTNYQHQFGVWFPYEGRAQYYNDLLSYIQPWLNDPMTITIWGKGRDLQRFINTCVFIAAMCRVVCVDMEKRCPKGKSFQTLGSLSLLKQRGLP